MNKKYEIEKGAPLYGATVFSTGVNFAVFSRNATKVTLDIFENFYDKTPCHSFEFDPNINKTGDVWHIFIKGLKSGKYYTYRVDGPYDIDNGHRFNPHKSLIDPYAKALSGKFNFDDEAMYSYFKTEHNTISEVDASQLIKGVIIDDRSYDWEGDKHPRTEFKDTIIYEMHVSLFTMNKNSNVKNRGTYRGIIEKVDHLKELGITAIELLPIFEFNQDELIRTNPVTGELLKNVWGYNPIGFFAPTGNYLSGDQTYGMRIGQQVFEFKDFIKEMHKNGIEVILDVVYNHTGEGNEMGPTISFKGFDNSIYYLLEKNKRYYANYSGTGNTFNCSHTVVKELIIDSLRYWATEMHVDGFRFDLAAILGRDSNGKWIGDMSLLKDIADDPILSGTKLIAEGWDAAGGYFVGEFPVGWAEWNGKFRDCVRKFIKGDPGQVSELATRIVGSPDLFYKYGRRPYHSINFITAHDGFTMWDLVSYNEKHNFPNGENNMDGANDNYSWNHGIEGETRDIKIINLRKRQLKNFMVILMLSQGVPMILMGDEFAKTQRGNNNAYCQDNETNWLDWSRKDSFRDIFRFFKKMVNFRKNHHSLKRAHFFKSEDISGNGVADITWHGTKLNKPDWSQDSRTLAFMISGEDFSDDSPNDNDIYVALNSYWEPLWFELPKLEGKKWYRVVDTYRNYGDDFLEEYEEIKDEKYLVMDRSSIILISKKFKKEK
ncbi:glycogen operon protein [Hypnocyclicus thermotrophus]|uniref:Glycogen operon protein n=1 Tax=Hypnocyclicus thermotrophus TaxID=1627895 RepID=A0AA46DZC7_9FUSO|nr:glycogen debranching protein GlgX [Hypnocyclicus thermotrophus]TDT71576.1 glycogen operon protein [Hypnocyclicus thermotrophus]